VNEDWRTLCIAKLYDHGSLVFQTTAICHCLLLPCRISGQLAEWVVLIRYTSHCEATTDSCLIKQWTDTTMVIKSRPWYGWSMWHTCEKWKIHTYKFLVGKSKKKSDQLEDLRMNKIKMYLKNREGGHRLESSNSWASSKLL
jgi:hypothetical protein